MIARNKATIASVEEQIYNLRKHVRYDIRDLTYEIIVNKYDESLDEDDREIVIDSKTYNLIYVPEYQRDFTWDEKRQSKFIESLILGLPVPLIFVAENQDSSWEIVDGSQRIRTMHSFFSNRLTLTGLESLTTLNGYFFKELDDARQGKILNTAIRIIVLAEETTEEIKKDMFERINRGSDLLKPMETRKGIYKGSFNTFIYDFCSRSARYREIVKLDKWLQNRQEYEERLLRFFALSENEAFKNGAEPGISSYLDKYLEKKNKEFDALPPDKREESLQEYEKKINVVLDIVEKHFPYGFRIAHNPQSKRSVFEAIAVGVWLVFERGKCINPKLTRDMILTKLNSADFKQFTHGATQLHKKYKLQGRIEFIYNMLVAE